MASEFLGVNFDMLKGIVLGIAIWTIGWFSGWAINKIRGKKPKMNFKTLREEMSYTFSHHSPDIFLPLNMHYTSVCQSFWGS